MKRRIRQFFRAIFARVGPADRQYVRTWLPESELQQLFGEMAEPDQCHALHTAYTALELAHKKNGVDEIFLVRIALLHDVGRVKGDLGLWGKVAVVLLNRFLPHFSRRHATASRDGVFGFWHHALYVYYHHAEIGSEKLRLLGCSREASVVRLHHASPTAGDSMELQLLRQADSLN